MRRAVLICDGRVVLDYFEHYESFRLQVMPHLQQRFVAGGMLEVGLVAALRGVAVLRSRRQGVRSSRRRVCLCARKSATPRLHNTPPRLR